MVSCPGNENPIEPPYMQVSLLSLLSAGNPPTVTVDEPGDHGASVSGTHGIGVSTPSAAAVAEATIGFAKDEHITKLGTFTNGLLSIIVAIGVEVTTRLSGNTLSGIGAEPNVQLIIAPEQTHIDILYLSLANNYSRILR